MIAGIFLVTAGQAAKVYLAGKVMHDTKTRLAAVTGALADYRTAHGRMPCPASLTAAPGDVLFGVEDSSTCSSGAPGAGTARVTNTLPAAVAAGVVAPNNTVRIGAVPFATLGIASEDSLDGWNNRLLYAVSEKLADTAVPYADTNGAITLLDNAPVPNVIGSNPHHTAFMLVSMGRAGRGAYTAEGKLKGGAPCSPAAGFAEENCDLSNATFRSTVYADGMTDAARFDNVVSSRITRDLAALCGAKGMLYGPAHPRADTFGCLPDMVEAATGNIGIGTATPAEKLDVDGSIRVNNSTSTSWAGLDMYLGGINRSTVYNTPTVPGSNIAFDTSGAIRMLINSAGHVGIGTGYQAVGDGYARMTVQGTSRSHITIESPDTAVGGAIGDFRLSSLDATGTARGNVGGIANWDMSFRNDSWSGPAPGSLTFYADLAGGGGSIHGMSLIPNGIANPHFYVSGKAGIGTLTPSAKLDVAGEVKIGNTGLVCAVATVGAMRYEPALDEQQFCAANGGGLGVPAWKATGGASGGLASKMGLDPSIFPDYVVCTGHPSTGPRVFTLESVYLGTRPAYMSTALGTASAGGVWRHYLFYDLAGNYLGFYEGGYGGDCEGVSVMAKKAAGQAGNY